MMHSPQGVHIPQIPAALYFPQLSHLQSWLQYISLLRKWKMKARVKSARQAMYARFPLAETLWREWLDDEIDVATSPAGATEVEHLFQQAVQDYLSINLWAKYLQ
jgi:hypothetical protein